MTSLPVGRFTIASQMNDEGLMIGGEIDIVTDKDIKEAIWQKGWEMYYPKGVYDPDHTILCLCPIVAKYYHQLKFAQFIPKTN